MPSTLAASPLVRLLQTWAPAELASGADVAERLSGALGPVQAIRLHALHHALATEAAEPAAPGRRRAGPTAQALDEDVARAHGALARAIAQDPLAIAFLTPGHADFSHAPYQQRHAELQRQMAQMVGALRDHVRQAVSRRSPRLRALAQLDAAFDELLAEREQALLPTTGNLLERRFHQLRTAHRQALEAAGTQDDPATWLTPGQWLATFTHEWRQALLAELDLRLEPVRGLVDALRQDESDTPHA